MITMAVAKVFEITAASTDSFEDAIKQGIAKASEAGEYRVDPKVTFVLD